MDKVEEAVVGREIEEEGREKEEEGWIEEAGETNEVQAVSKAEKEEVGRKQQDEERSKHVCDSTLSPLSSGLTSQYVLNVNHRSTRCVFFPYPPFLLSFPPSLLPSLSISILLSNMSSLPSVLPSSSNFLYLPHLSF